MAIAEKNWKAKTKDTVGGMIGIYLLDVRTNEKICFDHVLKEPNFLPVNTLSEEYQLLKINKDGYYIMPCTYKSRIDGAFILSVTSDNSFTLAQKWL